jgi:Asp-tRNA(Asn)/Glu-tRNA(Gln) amidotransferase A subunit family amidase
MRRFWGESIVTTQRRRFLVDASVTFSAMAGSVLVPWRTLHAVPQGGLTDLTAVSAVTAMRQGDIKAEDYARALLDRVAALESLNAFRVLDRELVLAAARDADRYRATGARLGALHGLPIPVKDSVNTKALPTSNGTRAMENMRPREDAAVLKLLFSQGALLMGKTNLHELSFGWTSNNLTFGSVKNPYDPTRIPGGSSGGSAAAVAAHMAPMAVAEDTHGSIRVPATMCGLTGLRPTYGRYPGQGILPITMNKFDQVGPFARSVADLALFDSAVTGDFAPLTPKPLSDVRIGVAPDYFLTGLDPEVERVMLDAVRRVQAGGATVVWAEMSAALNKALPTALTIQLYEVLRSLSAFLEQQALGISVDEVLAQVAANTERVFKAVVLPPNAVSDEAYQQALRDREEVRASVAAHFKAQAIDVLMFPPVMSPPPPLGDNREIEIAGEKVHIRNVMGRNTAPGSCASLCSLLLPAGLTSTGLPVGIEFDGMAGKDRDLLSLGYSLEKTLGAIPAPKL